MRAVLDTNIVIDLLHFADPQTLALQQAIARGTLYCFTDRPCLAELQRVHEDADDDLAGAVQHQFAGLVELFIDVFLQTTQGGQLGFQYPATHLAIIERFGHY